NVPDRDEEGPVLLRLEERRRRLPHRLPDEARSGRVALGVHLEHGRPGALRRQLPPEQGRDDHDLRRRQRPRQPPHRLRRQARLSFRHETHQERPVTEVRPMRPHVLLLLLLSLASAALALAFAPAPFPKNERKRSDLADLVGTWELVLWESGGS